MKKIIAVLVLLCIILSATWSGRPNTDNAATPSSTWISSSIGEIRAVFQKKDFSSLSGGNDGQSAPLDKATVFKNANDLARKAIMSDQDQKELTALLSSKANIDAAVGELKNYDTSDLAQNQKKRMKAGLFLLNALIQKNNPANEYVRAQIADLVLDPSLDQIADLKLKRSVVADRIELLMTLKRDYPSDAEKISSQASTELQKKMLTFATSFLNLNKKGT